MAMYQVLNPRRRRRRKATRAHARKRTRRRRRRNPVQYLLNPRRRRSHRRAHRRRFRHNPGLGGLSLRSLPIMEAVFVTAGVIGTNVGAGYAAGMLPPALQSGWGKTAVKAGIAVAAPLLLKRFIGGKNAKMLALGGFVSVVGDVIHNLAPTLPGLAGVSAYAMTGYEGAPAGFALGDAYGPADTVEDLSGTGEAYFDE